MDTTRSLAELIRSQAQVGGEEATADEFTDIDIMASNDAATASSQESTPSISNPFTKAQINSRSATDEHAYVGPIKPTLKRKLLARIGHPRDHKLKIFVCILFILIVICVVVPLAIYHKKMYEYEMGVRIRLNANTREIHVENEKRGVVLEGKLGMLIPGGLPYDCTDENEAQHKRCLRWKNSAELKMTFSARQGYNCYTVDWESLEQRTALQDCYSMRDAHWFGLGEIQKQKWPLERNSFRFMPIITGSNYAEFSPLGSVMERYWLSTRGVFISVHRDSPLFVSMNKQQSDSGPGDGQICFKSQYEDSPFPPPSHKRTVLNYTMCTHTDYKSLHQIYLQDFLNVSQVLPESKYFGTTLWSTWSYMKRNLNQTRVVQFGQDIKNHELSHSLLTIGDPWQSKYGDFLFNQKAFPNASLMFQQLRNIGFETGLWVHPFVNIDAASFQEGIVNDYFVHDAGGKVAGLTEWWHGPQLPQWSSGVAAVTDTTKQNAYDWLKQNLFKIKTQYGIDSFMFDAGQVSQLPSLPHLRGNIPDPNEYSRQYAQLASEFGTKSIVKIGTETQKFPLFIRMNTDTINEIIPKTLTLGLLGYPFIIPSPIGGNEYFNATSKELYIRWMQLVTFLPIMHFSTPPGKYGQDVIAMAKEMVGLHQTLVRDKVISLAEEYKNTGVPIIRPLWWIDPTDKVAQYISDQFLIGDDILVAPVVTVGSFTRDVYFPRGSWQDPKNQRRINGPKWVNSYPVRLNEVAYFLRN